MIFLLTNFVVVNAEQQETNIVFSNEDFFDFHSVSGALCGRVTEVAQAAPGGCERVLNVQCSDNGSGKFGVRYDLLPQQTVAANNSLMWNVVIRGCGGEKQVALAVLDEENNELLVMDYTVSQNWAQISLPIFSVGSESAFLIKCESLGTVQIASTSLVNYGGEITARDMACMAGVFDLTENTEDLLGEESFALNMQAKAVAVGDSCIFAADTGGEIYALGKTDFAELGRTNLGFEADFLQLDGEYLIAASRWGSVAFLDVSNPEELVAGSAYSAVGYLNGMKAYESTLFLFSHDVGLEAVDITNVSEPVQKGVIGCGSVNDVFILGGSLYLTKNGENKAEVYSASSLEKVAETELCGRGKGIAALTGDAGETYMFVQVCGSPSSAVKKAGAKNPNYGQSFGIEVFKVNSKTIQRVSFVYFNGRMEIDEEREFFGLRLSNHNGRQLLYALSGYGGVYIYDVTDKQMPFRVKHISFEGSYGDALREDGVIPDSNSAPVSAFDIEIGRIYMAVYNKAIAVYENAEEVGAPIYEENFNPTYKERSLIPESAAIADAVNYRTNGESIVAVCEGGGFIFAACAANGIKVFDYDLNLVEHIKSIGDVRDVSFANGTLYAACLSGGLRFFRVESGGIAPVGNAFYIGNSEAAAVRQVEVMPSGDRAVVVNGLKAYAVNVSDISNPYVYMINTGNEDGAICGGLYYEQVCSGFTDGRYIGISNSLPELYWLDFGGETPRIMQTFYNCYEKCYGGMAAYGGFAVSVGEGYAGYTYFKPAQLKTPRYPNIRIIPKTDAYFVSGKAAANENLLAVADIRSGKIILSDITDMNNPICHISFISDYSPYAPLIKNGKVYVPMGSGGLLRFSASSVGYTVVNSSDACSVKALADSGEDSVMIVAEYNGSGALLGIAAAEKMNSFKEGFAAARSVSLKHRELGYYKVFVLGKNAVEPFLPSLKIKTA